MMSRVMQILFDYATIKNTNIIYACIITLVVFINIYINLHASFNSWVAISGTITQIALPAYAFVPILWKKDKSGFVQMLLLLFIVISITQILKHTIPSTRPHGGTMSFPSGHTSGAFIGSVFLTIRYGLKYFLISTPFAIFVGFSRLYAHKHWPIDVVSSVVLCVIVGLCCVRKNI